MADFKANIREMEAEDITGILEIDHKIRGRSRAMTYSDFWQNNMKGQIKGSYVAEQDGQIIGFVLSAHAYIPEELTDATIIQIFGVDPDYQKKGIAKKLFEKLLENCRATGIKSVRVMIEERDSALRAFFERIGFARAPLINYSITP